MWIAKRIDWNVTRKQKKENHDSDNDDNYYDLENNPKTQTMSEEEPVASVVWKYNSVQAMNCIGT